jgi:hypothetical protein
VTARILLLLVIALHGCTPDAHAHDFGGARSNEMSPDPRSWRGFSVDLRTVVEGIEGERGVVVRAAPDDGSNTGRVTVDFGGDGALRFSVSGAAARRLLEDGGRSSVPAGTKGTVVRLPAQSAGDVLSAVVNTRGVVEARSLVIHGGVARLLGGDTATAALQDDGHATVLAPPPAP